MLHSNLFEYKVFIAIKNGFYMDFFYKKLAEVFIRNFFLYSAQFFGEKYIIEYLTKYTVDRFVYFFGASFEYYSVNPSKLFIQVFPLLFYILSLLLFLLLYF